MIGRHFAYLQGLAQNGAVLLFGRTTNADYSTFGIAIFRAESGAAAHALMAADPAVKERVMHGELYPYRVAGINLQLARELESM